MVKGIECGDRGRNILETAVWLWMVDCSDDLLWCGEAFLFKGQRRYTALTVIRYMWYSLIKIPFAGVLGTEFVIIL